MDKTSRDISWYICNYFALFRNGCVFIPVFLAEHLTMFCGTLFGRHCSRHSHFTDHYFPPHYFHYTIRIDNMLWFLNLHKQRTQDSVQWLDWRLESPMNEATGMAKLDTIKTLSSWCIIVYTEQYNKVPLKNRGMVVRFPTRDRDFSLLPNV